ncbi:MAG TPA: hypothetical protein VKF59_22260 [Candidatus Dormibacteraeota bacterium]|nr:hypothetical protein [Candidatus Dormibacteraeota bacterium]
MERLDGPRIDAAERFVWLFGRLLDRRRFAYLFRAGDPEAVVAALRPYGNPDGGVGHALEPDLRGPSSQPVPAEHALRVLDEVDRFDDPLVAGVCDWLTGVSRPDGGVPFLLPTTPPEPSAPWWQAPDDPSGSLNPTAALAGLLHARGVAHPWLVPATAFCWRGIEALERAEPYETRAVLTFLEHVPDRPRADRALERVGALLLAGDVVEQDPEAARDLESHRPLDFAPTPASPGRRLFSGEVIECNLRALEAAQEADGGWTVDWPAWTPSAGTEWRAWRTVEALQVLRAYGR